MVIFQNPYISLDWVPLSKFKFNAKFNLIIVNRHASSLESMCYAPSLCVTNCVCNIPTRADIIIVINVVVSYAYGISSADFQLKIHYISMRIVHNLPS